MSITAVSLYLTEACNLRCRYCFVSKQPRRMEPELGQEVIDFMLAAPKDVKRVSVYFFGGEPLLEFDLLRQLTLYGRRRAHELDRKIHFGLTTNGTFLTGPIMDFLFDQNMSINLSLDGAPATHDANRKTVNGRGSFELVDKVIDAILERNPAQGVRMTYDSQSVNSLYEDHVYLWSRGFTKTSPIPVFEDDWDEVSLGLAREQLERIAADVISAMRRGETRQVNFLTKFARRLANYRHRMAKPCGACTSYIAITTDGLLYPCQRFAAHDAYPFGTLDKVTAPENRKLFLKYNANRMAECAQCPANLVCSGGCLAANYLCTGDIYRPSPNQCEFIRIESRIAQQICTNLEYEGDPLLDRLLGRNGKSHRGRASHKAAGTPAADETSSPPPCSDRIPAPPPLAGQ